MTNVSILTDDQSENFSNSVMGIMSVMGMTSVMGITRVNCVTGVNSQQL